MILHVKCGLTKGVVFHEKGFTEEGLLYLDYPQACASSPLGVSKEMLVRLLTVQVL